MLIPVIVAGGQGSRLTPVSTPECPKPFLDLLDCGKSLLELTLERAQLVSSYAPIIICAGTNYARVNTILKKMALDAHVVLEVNPCNTAPAIACAGLYAEQIYGKDACLLVMPADHYLPNTHYFEACVNAANHRNLKSDLVVFGALPSYPETGFGYIERDENNCFIGFHEKPKLHVAQTYLASGRYLWNCGFFLFPIQTLLSDLRRHANLILSAAEEAFLKAKFLSENCLRLSYALTNNSLYSIDYALLEKSTHVQLASYDEQWSDIGTWASLFRLWKKDCDESAYNKSLGLVIKKSERALMLYQNEMLLQEIQYE